MQANAVLDMYSSYEIARQALDLEELEKTSRNK